jgi:adenosylmethionine-8-amino-7-oxononanoate aminotransferase
LTHHEAGFALDAGRGLTEGGRPTLWLPYAQMRRVRPPQPVKSAQGPYLHLEDGRTLIDAVSSWWSVIHGYNHPELTEAARSQMDQVPHVMLGGLVHETTQQFADKLAAIAPGSLNHVFFGDSGSVGVEIALKMAVQYWQNQGYAQKQKIAALNKAYHGDTAGCMSVCDPEEGMHSLFAGIVPEQYFLEAPRGGIEAAEATVDADVAGLEALFEKHHHALAAFIVEPLMQAAGGFNMYSPAYLQKARQLCDKYGVVLIYDEVATGFGRTGAMFAAERAGARPDIMVLGKGMTAGYASHSATIASSDVFDAFAGDTFETAFMHGPTFMGNAMTAAVALKGIELFERENYLDRIARIEAQLKRALLPLRDRGHARIADVRVLGATGVVEATDAKALAGLQDFAMNRGVWLRPFDRFAYTMPPYVVSDEDLASITGVLRDWFANG